MAAGSAHSPCAVNHSVSISVSGVTQFQLVPGTFPHSGVSVANASTQPNAAAGSRETAAPCRVSPPHIASPATAASAISTSAGTHRAATLFCMILIEIAFLAGGLSLLPFAEKKMDKPVAALLLAMGLIGVLLHEFALWGGGAARLGRLYAAVADPVTLSVFSALGCAGIRALVLDKRTKKA